MSLKPIEGTFKGVTPSVAIDCEMVMCETPQGQKHQIARVSIVNYNGYTLYDKYVKPSYKIGKFIN